MTKKEKTERAALYQRLLDMMLGAFGGYEPINFEGTPDDDDALMGLQSDMGLDAWGRWLGAINRNLLDKHHKFLINFNHLEHFEWLYKAADHLFEHGVRAVKPEQHQ